MIETSSRVAALAVEMLSDDYSVRYEYDTRRNCMVLIISKRNRYINLEATLDVTAVERNMSDEYIRENLIKPLRAALEAGKR